MIDNAEEFEVKGGYAEIFDVDEFLRAIRAIGIARACRVVCLDADRLAGTPHAVAAVIHAMRAWDRRSGIADSIEMEILCYASGSRQCSAAQTFGIHRGSNRLYIAVFPPKQGAVKDLQKLVTFTNDCWDELTGEKRRRLGELFHITSLELAAAGEEKFRELVLERVALLDVYK
ncbi:MAG: KEOPS complex subunit Cgi121 [Methanomicrobiales archaeon]|nr:KEOPS complex subunit Cgi121 [Methanomicrobiales archaeon]